MLKLQTIFFEFLIPLSLFHLYNLGIRSSLFYITSLFSLFGYFKSYNFFNISTANHSTVSNCFIAKPRYSSNLFKLIQTNSNSSNLFKPFQTSSNLFKPFQTSSNLFKPLQTFSNLFKLQPFAKRPVVSLQKYEMMQLRASLADRPPYRKFLIIVGLTLIGAVLFTAIGAGLCKVLFGVDLAGNPDLVNQQADPALAAAFRLFQGVAAIGTFIVPALLAAFLFSSNEKKYLGLDKKPQGVAVFLVFMLLIVAIPFINWMMQVNSAMHLPAALQGVQDWMSATEEQAAKITKMLLGSTMFSDLLINLVIIAILPAIGEEMLFRGIIQKQFVELANNKHAAVLLTAFLFSALHMQFFGFLPRFALGILLGYLYLWSGSLWLSIAAHFINNASAVVLTWVIARYQLTINPDTLGLEPGQEALLAISVFMSLGGVWLLRKQYSNIPTTR